tara:strand:- start:102 stop:764 length:663 start_codon:yes stop_codon:yes gene_type:complete
MRAPRPVGRFTRLLSTGALVLVLAGCQTAYYAAWEKLGYEKRDILTSRVEDARDAQTEAKEEVVSALESFSKAVNYEGGELETQYKRFAAKLDDSEAAAANVRDRVSKVEATASALFDEWRSELGSYNNQELLAVSERQLGETKSRYNTMIAAMRTARDRLEPALRPLRDQVLFMKHNLNASALASLKGEIKIVNAEVDRLIADINKAVEQADGFIDQLR